MPSIITASSAITRIAEIAASAPDAVAIADRGSTVTFREIDARANALATRLLDADLPLEAPVALLLNRSADYVVAALAVMKAGGAYLPIDPATPAARTEFILRDSGAFALIAHPCLMGGVATPCPVMHLGAETGPAPETGIDPEGLAYIIYTSGSTGEPKGVEITHANLNGLVDWHVRAFDVSPTDRASQIGGLGFDASVWEIWCHLCAGAAVHLVPDNIRTSVVALHAWLIENGITICFAPTVLAQQLIALEWPEASRLRVLLTGADRLLQRPPAGLPFLFFNNYGPTEATVLATSGLVTPEGDGTPGIGLPANGARILLLDGELCIAGPLVGRGYRNRLELTASKFVMHGGERIYRTGDRARLLPSGEYEFLGRIDNQVKIRGYRIEPDEVACVLARQPGVRDAVVVARDITPGEPGLAAYFVASKTATTDRLRDALAELLPEYMIPHWFIRMDALPLNASGKCDRSALPAPGSAPQSAPEGNFAERIGGIVAKLLGRDSVDPSANFFLLGGHSLLAAQLMIQVNKTFGVKMALRQIFQAPTVKQLAAAIAGLKEGK